MLQKYIEINLAPSIPPEHASHMQQCTTNLKEKPQLPWEEGEKGDQCRGNYMKKGAHLNAPNP